VEADTTAYIAFRYNGLPYKIANEHCTFTRYADNHFVVTGWDTDRELALTISVVKRMDAGGVYNIVAPFRGEMASVHILFSSGRELAEESLASENNEPLGIIGQLSISGITGERLSGSFSCRTTHGEITDGQFSVGAKRYE
jgi:hypothetical protein